VKPSAFRDGASGAVQAFPAILCPEAAACRGPIDEVTAMRTTIRRTRFLAAAALGLLVAGPEALAGPPPWAPAHGYRAKQAERYTGYTGYRWNHDYGISRGRCNRDEVGTVVGAVIGGAIGAAVHDGGNDLVAILAGAAIGAIIGREIGRDMNDSDRACMGHALEIGQMGQRIYWDGGQPDLGYAVTLRDGFKRDGYTCRNFVFERDYGGRKASEPAAACRVGDGQWQLVRR
jgi:surface antigen